MTGMEQFERLLQCAKDTPPAIRERRTGAEELAWRGWDNQPPGFADLLDLMPGDRMPRGMGWILSGPPGCGKTSRARLAARRAGIRFRGADDMVLAFRESRGGLATLNEIARLPLAADETAFRTPDCDLVIDDLGREIPRVLIYGEPRDPMREMLERRLDLWPRIRTYATTNLTPGELEKRYGARVASRMAAAMAFLAMPGHDWRAEAAMPGWK